jgi:hypothetical protein
VPSSSKRQQPRVVLKQSKKMKTSGVGDLSMTSGGGKTDYLETKKMYKKFWTECQECFVFQVDMNYTISIEQMERAPIDWTTQEYEEQGILNTKHYLVNMSDPLVKQTLYVMPNTNVRPKTWEDITNGKFFNING